MHAQSGTYVSGPACGSYNASSPSGKNTSAGFPCPWSGFDRWAIIPAAVHVHASRGVRFSNCSFRRLGATAVAFDKGSQNCSVASSLVEDVSGNGVQIGTIDSYNETVSSPTQLKSALFHNMPAIAVGRIRPSKTPATWWSTASCGTWGGSGSAPAASSRSTPVGHASCIMR